MLKALYPYLRPLLFKIDPERTHHLALKMLNQMYQWGLLQRIVKPLPDAPCTVMGLRFPNPVGLAAGMDRHAECIDALGLLGFGFIEVGTLTPQPQAGHPKPRLFRLPEYEALINRFGFYNKGVEHALPYLKKRTYKGILGVSIVKNATVSWEDAAEDYVKAFKQVYPYADYIAINVSSPNTEGLRNLQHGELLDTLLRALKAEQLYLASKHQRHVPLVVKVAPDLDQTAIEEMAALFLQHHVEGVIATNTSTGREGVMLHPLASIQGGLSGRPITQQATRVVRAFHTALKGQIPIIGCGGIMSAEDAQDKFDAGASLIQLYTGLIYRGPKLISDIINSLPKENR